MQIKKNYGIALISLLVIAIKTLKYNKKYFNSEFSVHSVFMQRNIKFYIFSFHHKLNIEISNIKTSTKIKFSETQNLSFLNKRIIKLKLNTYLPPTALGQAVNLAKSIAKFPKAALNHDRNSFYTSFFDSKPFEQKSLNEVMAFSRDVLSEMKKGLEMGM